MNKIYIADTKYTGDYNDHKQDDGRPWYGVNGPNPGSFAGFGYYAFNASAKFEQMNDAKKAALLCNAAYEAGYEKAKREIREALGLEK